MQLYQREYTMYQSLLGQIVVGMLLMPCPENYSESDFREDCLQKLISLDERNSWTQNYTK